jgi:glycogen operon protein
VAALIMNTPERPLHNYLKDVSECTGVRVGTALPLGTFQREGGVDFAVFRRHATLVQLELFDLLMDGPYQLWEGHRFNFHKLLLEPFTTEISQVHNWDFGQARGYDPSALERDLVCSLVDDAVAMPKCVFTHEHFHWQGDRPLRHPWSKSKTVIYETHVRGFTTHPSSGVVSPSSYRGLMERISYLKDLGMTAVELMPVQEFNENQAEGINPQTGQPLRNYWGYNPAAFFAPKASCSSSGGFDQQKLLARCMASTRAK